jgi:hypothetical protein
MRAAASDPPFPTLAQRRGFRAYLAGLPELRDRTKTPPALSPLCRLRQGSSAVAHPTWAS